MGTLLSGGLGIGSLGPLVSATGSVAVACSCRSWLVPLCSRSATRQCTTEIFRAVAYGSSRRRPGEEEAEDGTGRSGRGPGQGYRQDADKDATRDNDTIVHGPHRRC